MKYTIDKQADYTIFQLKEQNLNSVIAPDLKSEFFILYQEGVEVLIFDMSEVEFIDSSGLSALLAANRLWAGGGFIVASVRSEFVQNLIEISRIDSVIHIEPDLEAARAYAAQLESPRQSNPEQ